MSFHIYMRIYQLSFTTDHFQFYLEDAAVEHDTSNLWNTTTTVQSLATRDGLIAVGIQRWGKRTHITIVCTDAAPLEEDQDWDQIVEASLQTCSGMVYVTAPEGTTEGAPQIPLAPGSYRVRVYFGALGSVDDELAADGQDHYRLVLWPDTLCETHILKHG